MIKIKFPENIHSLTEHIIYVIVHNPGISRYGFGFEGFAQASISNYTSKIVKRGLIENKKGFLFVTKKGRKLYEDFITNPIPTMQLVERVLKVISREPMSITQIAQKLFPDIDRGKREKPVRLVIARLHRDNRVINTKPIPGSCAYYIKGTSLKKKDTIKNPKTKMNDLFLLGSITKQRELI